MRGIAELVEVSHAPPTPSPVTLPPAAAPPQLNGMGVASEEPPCEDTAKTPEPPAPEVTAPLQGPPSSKPLPPPQGNSVESPGPGAGSNFAKMRRMLAKQMGLSAEAEGVDGSGSERASQSPSTSPVHRTANTAAPPPPKRGGTQTSLTAPNRHSFSSSTSSLSSNPSHDHQTHPPHTTRELPGQCGKEGGIFMWVGVASHRLGRV